MTKQSFHPVLFFLICLSIPSIATAQAVDIPDSYLRSVIATELGKTPEATITVADMETLTELDAFGTVISNLTGLEAATNLTSLNLEYNLISDISPLAGLTNLTILVLSRNYIPDISAVAELTSLTRLELYENRIVDISPLAGLTRLQILDIENNRISDLSPLVANIGLENGDEVNLKGNFLNAISVNTHIPALQSRGVLVEFDNIVIRPEDITQTVDIPDPNLRAAIAERHLKAPDEAIALADMLTLTGLYVSGEDISDLAGLEAATNLTHLRLGHSSISDLSPLAGLTNLTQLWLWNNSISDISPIAGLTNLTDLWLGGNSISDLSPLAGLANLTALELEDNDIIDISALAGLTDLAGLALYDNNITDISALAGLTNLTFLALGHNSISDISPIAGLTNLVELWIHSNSISDLSPLVENIGLGSGDQVDVRKNFLNAAALNTHIPALQSRGVRIYYHDIIVQPEDIAQTVDIPDPNLRAAIVDERGKPAGNTITLADMLILIELRAPGDDISDLTGLEHATNLKILSLSNNSISDLSPLVANVGLGIGDWVDVSGNFLNDVAINTHIPTLQARWVTVEFDNIVVRPDDIAQTVDIPDPNLRAAIAEKRGKAPNDIITVADMLVLTRLSSYGSNISDLTGLEYATNLTTLRLDYNSISDISTLAGLNNLAELNLGENSISDISALAGLTNLTELWLDYNSISDISPLIRLINLTDLRLDNNSISDISPVAELNNLTRLTLSQNSISDISPVAGLNNLTQLTLSQNSISDISPLIRFTKLTTLQLDNNSISDITPLIRLINLTELNLRGNLISNLSPLVENPGLGRGTSVDVRNNPLSYVSINTHIFFLQFDGVEIYFDDTVTVSTDVNSDGAVNIFDLVLVAGMLGNEDQNLMADVNGDGVVSIFDLILVAGMFDAAAAAPSAQAEPSEMLTAATIRGWLIDAKALEITDPIMERGIMVLEQLLASLTPIETQLLPNYPNPFNPETWIPYRLAEDAFVTLTIYDRAGQVVRTIDVGLQAASTYESQSQAIYWDGRNEVGEQVASGVYFYHLSAGDYSATRKMMILK